MDFKTSNETIIKIKEEINKKGFFAFDVLENNFLSENFKEKFKEINENILNKNLEYILIIKIFIIIFISFILFTLIFNNYIIEYNILIWYFNMIF